MATSLNSLKGSQPRHYHYKSTIPATNSSRGGTDPHDRSA
jgi:hypothetical protein